VFDPIANDVIPFKFRSQSIQRRELWLLVSEEEAAVFEGDYIPTLRVPFLRKFFGGFSRNESNPIRSEINKLLEKRKKEDKIRTIHIPTDEG